MSVAPHGDAADDRDQEQLSSFSDDAPRPPFLHCDAPVVVRVPKQGQLLAGYRGPVPARRAYGFLQFCKREKHRIRALDAYALSEIVVKRLRLLGCKVVLLAEQDTGMVYEFHERQFNQHVPKRYNPGCDDPQLYVPVSEAWGATPNHAGEVLIQNE